MDTSANGLWELLFGVNDPALNGPVDCVKTDPDASQGQFDLPEDFLALLSDPATQNALNNFVLSPNFGQGDLIVDDGIVSQDSAAANEFNPMDELGEFLQMPDMTSSTSGSDEDNDTHSLSSSSLNDSPMSVHSDTSSERTHSTGKEELKLSKEELQLLQKEGLSLPKFLPLSKQDERILKKIRRKIRNKKSAQESRRKKKVYVDQLEDQVKDVTNQNKTLSKRVKDLEKENLSLQQQLRTLQSVLSKSTRTTKATGTCLMALVLSVALIVTPYNKNVKDTDAETKAMLVGTYEPENAAPVQSRLMFGLDGPPDIKNYAIPIKHGYKNIVVAPASNSVQLEAWEGEEIRAAKENLTVEIPRKRTEAVMF